MIDISLNIVFKYTYDLTASSIRNLHRTLSLCLVSSCLYKYHLFPLYIYSEENFAESDKATPCHVRR